MNEGFFSFLYYAKLAEGKKWQELSGEQFALLDCEIPRYSQFPDAKFCHFGDRRLEAVSQN